jgi:hypothetical protein
MFKKTIAIVAIAMLFGCGKSEPLGVGETTSSDTPPDSFIVVNKKGEMVHIFNPAKDEQANDPDRPISQADFDGSKEIEAKVWEYLAQYRTKPKKTDDPIDLLIYHDSNYLKLLNKDDRTVQIRNAWFNQDCQVGNKPPEFAEHLDLPFYPVTLKQGGFIYIHPKCPDVLIKTTVETDYGTFVYDRLN